MYFDALYEEWHEADLDAMIRRDANYPCVVLWSVGNEVRGQYSEQFFRCLEEMCTLTRQKDPTRAVTAALIMFLLPEYNDTPPPGQAPCSGPPVCGDRRRVLLQLHGALL